MSSLVMDTAEITLSSLLGGAISSQAARMVRTWRSRGATADDDEVLRGKSRRSRINPVASWALIGALLFGSVTYFLVRPSFLSSCPIFASTNMVFTSPTDGSVVPQSVVAHGTACHIPQDKEVWLLVMAGGVAGYYPQNGPVIVSSDGKWSASAFLGTADTADAEREFVLYTALVDQEGKAAIQGYFASAPDFKPLDPLPAGIQLISQVQVVHA